MGTTRATSSRRSLFARRRDCDVIASSRPARRTEPARIRCAVVVLSGAGLLSCSGVDAESFRVESSVGISETLTNNVNLAPRASARSELITQFTPGFSISETGSRVRLIGSVALPIVFYARTGGDNNKVYAQANLTGNAEVIDKFFFIDGSASVSQQFLTPLGAQPADLTNATQNRYTSQSYSVSPYVRGVTQGSVNYAIRDDNIWTNTSGAPVSVNGAYTNNLTATLSKNPAPFGWGAEYNRTEIRFQTQPQQLKQLGRLRLSHQSDPQLQLSVSGGYEDDDFASTRFRGSTYGVGASWRPTERTNVDASWEHRFFGASYSFNFSHRTPLTVWNVSASRNLTNYPQQLAALPGGAGVQSVLNQLFLSSIPDPVQRQTFIEHFIRDRGLPSFLSGPVILFTESFTLLEQASATVGLLGARNSIFFSVFRGRQEPITGTNAELIGILGTLRKTTQEGVSAVWTHNLASQLTFVLTGSASRSKSDAPQTALGGLGKSRQGNISAALATALSANTTANAGIRYQALRSDLATSYSEAAIYVNLSHRFH